MSAIEDAMAGLISKALIEDVDHPHAVIGFDPVTRSFVTMGPFPSWPATLEHIEQQRAKDRRELDGPWPEYVAAYFLGLDAA